MVISEVGHRGDGIADINGESVFVPCSAPGDRLVIDRIGNRGSLIEIKTAGPDRVDPPCPHYGECGGCAMQHVSREFEADWKKTKLIRTLEQRGLNGVDLLEPIEVPEKSRRRTAFSVIRQGSNLIFGYQKRGSHKVVDLANCPILTSGLDQAIVPTKDLLHLLMPQNTRAKAQVTEFDNGVELHISMNDMTLADLSMQQIEAITSCVAKGGLIRVTLNDEVVLSVEEPLVKFGSVAVNPPSGAFLQPCKLSEIELQKSVVEVVSKRCSAGDLIADLFCGCGTFTFPLASNFKVDAYDSDAEQIQAMQRAITAQPSVNRVTPTKRDLFERPLIGKELESLACAVLDPPRAGARFQVEHLALAGVPLIIYVSCNLASFARDCRTLVDHGYRLENVTPIDQFKFSAHLECIGVLSLAAENHP